MPRRRQTATRPARCNSRAASPSPVRPSPVQPPPPLPSRCKTLHGASPRPAGRRRATLRPIAPPSPDCSCGAAHTGVRRREAGVRAPRVGAAAPQCAGPSPTVRCAPPPSSRAPPPPLFRPTPAVGGTHRLRPPIAGAVRPAHGPVGVPDARDSNAPCGRRALRRAKD